MSDESCLNCAFAIRAGDEKPCDSCHAFGKWQSSRLYDENQELRVLKDINQLSITGLQGLHRKDRAYILTLEALLYEKDKELSALKSAQEWHDASKRPENVVDNQYEALLPEDEVL